MLGPRDYDQLINKYALQFNVSPRLVRAVIEVESSWDPKQVKLSRIGPAIGLMQLTPNTAREHGVSDPYDPDQNIRGGIMDLRAGLDRAMAAGVNPVEGALRYYNAGGVTKRTEPNYLAHVAGHYQRDAGIIPGAAVARAPATSAGPPPAVMAGPAMIGPAMAGPAMVGPDLQPLPRRAAVTPPPAAGAPKLAEMGPPLPWSATGAPPSNQFAPPSLFTADSPAAAARYAQASTPQGYADLARLAAAGAATGSPPGGLPPPPPKPTPPPLPMVGADLTPLPAPPPPQQQPAAAPARAVSDEELSRMGSGDVFGLITRSDLTPADRAAVNDWINRLSQQEYPAPNDKRRPTPSD